MKNVKKTILTKKGLEEVKEKTEKMSSLSVWIDETLQCRILIESFSKRILSNLDKLSTQEDKSKQKTLNEEIRNFVKEIIKFSKSNFGIEEIKKINLLAKEILEILE